MEKSLNELNEQFRTLFELKKPDARAYSPLTLAYLGDAVYEIIIRSIVVSQSNAPVQKLHKRSSDLVKASAQAGIIKKIEDMLSEDELAVYKRGRNAKSYTVAKNASMTDYRMATGFEALMGYLFLQGQMERILELVHAGIKELV